MINIGKVDEKVTNMLDSIFEKNKLNQGKLLEFERKFKHKLDVIFKSLQF